jgi:putative ABC transport system ATP-binding protein
MTTLEPVFEARNVRKVFGSNVVALDGVNLTVFPGEWIAITGTSGAGKTTLLQLFAALDQPTSGQILYHGQGLSNLREIDGFRRRSVGIVFQLHNLLPHLNVRDNIEIAMMGNGSTKRARVARVTELVTAVGLEQQQLRKPPELSGGERQRAAIARALANAPEVLLADEPTGNLDPEQVNRLLQLLKRLNHEHHTTIIMVTHDSDVAAHAHRVVVLHAGQLAESSVGCPA